MLLIEDVYPIHCMYELHFLFLKKKKVIRSIKTMSIMSLTLEYYSRDIDSEKLSCFWETTVYSHLWTIKLSMRKAADLNIMQQT